MKNYTFNVEEIFEDIAGDPDNVMMKIPEEIQTELGWVEGDELTVTMETDGSIVLRKL